MKRVIMALTMVAALHSAGAMAHGSHGVVSESGALAAAARTVQKMTLKDLGYAAGQLDTSWQALNTDQIKLINKSDDAYQYAVTNKETGQVLYVKILKSGKAQSASFSQE